MKRFALFFMSFVFCASGVVWAQTSTSTSATTSPSSYTTESSCTVGGAKWCKNSDGVSGWCTSTSTTCPAYDEPSCKVQSGQWCKYQSGTGGWCATGSGASCPINDEPTCTSKGRIWCKSNTTYTAPATPASSGWCANTGEKCPAYDSATCKAQGGEWCASTGGAVGTTTSGWCATGSSTCPISDETTCTSKGRMWCKSQSGGSGWCTSSTSEKCPAYDDASCKAQSGQWCGTWCATGSSTCPNYDKEQTDCTTKGNKWCKNSDGTSGWCSYSSSPCPAYDSATCKAQSGEWCAYQSGTGGWCATGSGASCPINDEPTCTLKGRKWCTTTAAGMTTMSGWCANTSETCPSTTKPPTPEYDYCQNNIKVLKGEKCPTTDEYTICSDGSKAPKGMTCPPLKTDEYTICSDGSKAPKGMACPPLKEEQKLTNREIRDIEKQKKRLLQDLTRIEKIFKKINDTETLAKIGVLRVQLEGLKLDSMAYDSLETIRDDVEILEDLKPDVTSIEQDDRDKEMQKKALAKFRRGLVKFEAKFLKIQKRIQKLENKKISVSQDLKDAVAKVQTLVKIIRTTSSYDEAKDAGESLIDQTELMNDLLPKLTQLEQAPRLNRIVKFIQTEVTKRERSLKTISAQAKKAKVDVAEEFAALTVKMQAVQTVLENIKNGEFGDYAPSEYIQESIFIPLQDIDNDIEALDAITKFKSYVGKLEAKSVRYTAQIRRVIGAEKKAEATALHKSLKDDLVKLKTYKSKGDLAKLKEISQDDSVVLATLTHAIDTADELDTLLGLLSTTLFDGELEQLRGSKDSSNDTNTLELEELSAAASRIAAFYRGGLERVGLAYQKPKRPLRALAQDF